MNKIILSRNKEKIISSYNKMCQEGIHFTTISEDNYPKKLKTIYDPPFWLFYKGELPDSNKPSIAIIGARICTAYGREIALSFSYELSQAGVQVISGMAAGVDGFAHRGALSAGHKTYGVLGCGVDICYPLENIEIYQKIQIRGGLISEYALGVSGIAFHFPMRNRIISGLSDGILVVEAREKSGTFITVDCALEQGREVFAVPGRVGDKLSSGCNRLIQTGAKLVWKTKDILEELEYRYGTLNTAFHVKNKENVEEYRKIKNIKQENTKINHTNEEGRKREKKDSIKNNNNLLETEEKIVYANLSLVPKHIEALLYETALPVDILMGALFQLELKDLIKQATKNYYILNLV